MTLYGYGKRLDIDLSMGSIVKRDIDPQFAREYIGGMGFGCRILYDEVASDVDPLGPENLVIFANGPLTGTQAPCAGRTEATTKSPLTGNIGTGNTGGLWGAMLKRTGFDVIVVRGKAQHPVYISIEDDAVRIGDASHLWGMDTRATSDVICRQADKRWPSKISVMAIGPAGENQVRFACPINDYHHAAARAGLGAVMGAKRLKAIAVSGTGQVRAAMPEEFRQAAGEARDRLLANMKIAETGQRDVIPNMVQYNQSKGCLPHKNYQTGVLPGNIANIDRSAALQYCKRHESTCYACPRSCFLLAEVEEGKYAGVEAARGHHPGVVSEWGARCGIDNLPAIWKCKQLCQHLGMDYVSASGTVAFALELFQRGIITEQDTGGLELTWGNEDAIFQMLHNIAHREGFGDVLAEGSQKAAAIIGRGAEHYAMTIKGLEMMSLDPRSSRRAWALGAITNPRGGDNVKTTHCMGDRHNPNWWTDEFDMFEDVKRRIYDLPPEEVSTSWKGKPLMCKWFEDLYSALNALGVCFFPAGMNLAIGPTHLSKLYSAYTGWKTTPEDMMASGERIFNLFKACAARHGLTRQDDTWPDRFFDEPLPEGPSKGAVLSRETIAGLLDEYYALRGWSKSSSIPSSEKLIELGLGGIADDFLRQGLK